MDRRPGALIGRVRGPIAIVVATAIAGVLGIVLTILAGRTLGAAGSAIFSALWSAVYFSIGAISGIQQEVTRASRPIGPGEPAAPLARFAALAALVAAAAVLAVSPLWLIPVFGGIPPEIVVPVVVAPLGYAAVAVVAGALGGLRRWGTLAVMIVVDAVLRLAAVSVVLALGGGIVALAWAVAAPFGLALVLVWPLVRRSLRPGVAWAASARRVGANAAATVTGALGTAALVSGFAVLLVATSGDVPRPMLGALAFAVSVVRSPLVVTSLALQGVLIVRFRDALRPVREVALAAAVVAVGTVLLGGVAVVVGDPVLAVVAGRDFQIGAPAIATIVASSGLIAVMVVVGALLIARARQVAYAAAWLIAALICVLACLSPLPFEVRFALATLAAPVGGVLAQVVALAVGSRERAQS